MAYGIGFVGLGSITSVHQDGYARFGLPVVAGYDPAPQARRNFALRQPQAKVYTRLEELLDDPQVEVIDLATPHHRPARLPIIEQVAARKKPVLIQKPMAMNYQDALAIVEILEASGTPAMVNQNMCFIPSALDLPRFVLEEKVLGQPFYFQMELRTLFDCTPDHWFGKDERWWLVSHTVHQLSILHLLFGPPTQVYAITGKDPAQPGVSHDGFSHLALTYPGGLDGMLLSTGTYYGANPKPYGTEELWIQGPQAILEWEPECACTITHRAAPDSPEKHPSRGKWFPDAFGLVMSHFQQALSQGKTPLCSVADNLNVMAVIEAGYLSSQRKQVVQLEEILGQRYHPTYGPGWLHGFNRWRIPAPVESSHQS